MKGKPPRRPQPQLPDNVVVIKLTPEAIKALREQGVGNPPQQVTLTHREATAREQERFQLDQAEGGPAKTDSVNWVIGLLMRRSDVTDVRVWHEVLRDMNRVDIASHTTAYITGEMPDPKLMSRAVSGTFTGMTNQLLAVLATANTPSSGTSTPESPTPS